MGVSRRVAIAEGLRCPAMAKWQVGRALKSAGSPRGHSAGRRRLVAEPVRRDDVRNRGLANVIFALGLVFLVPAIAVLFVSGGITPALIIGPTLLLLGSWLQKRSRQEPPSAPPGALPPPPP